MLLWLNALSHLLVDGVCAAALFGPVRASAGSMTALVLLYNTLAFSTQAAVGLGADRLRRHGAAAALSMLLVAAGYFLPLGGVARVVCVGLGNSVFHVAGGAMTLERSGGRAGPLGVFVAPGAVGLAIGTLWPRWGVYMAALLVLCAGAVIPAQRRSPVRPSAPETGEPSGGLLLPLLLAAAVAVRAVGGTAVSFPWKQGAGLTLLTAAVVCAGKTAGGFLCDRTGHRAAALMSLLPAAALIAFCGAWMAPSLLGQFALNLTMPVTLWLLYRAMPDEPGFAFGLAASALWPGTLAGMLLQLTGPALWACVILCFLFGLWAVLFCGKKLQQGGMLT